MAKKATAAKSTSGTNGGLNAPVSTPSPPKGKGKAKAMGKKLKPARKGKP